MFVAKPQNSRIEKPIGDIPAAQPPQKVIIWGLSSIRTTVRWLSFTAAVLLARRYQIPAMCPPHPRLARTAATRAACPVLRGVISHAALRAADLRTLSNICENGCLLLLGLHNIIDEIRRERRYNHTVTCVVV